MGYPKRLLSRGERIVSQFRPHWKAILWPVVLSVAVLAGAIVLLVMTEGTASRVGAGVLGLVWLVLAFPRLVVWYFTSYVITSERLIVRSGVFSRRGKEIPLEVINDIAFTQTIGERILRSGDLLIESAGAHGQSRYSDIPDPEGTQSLVYELRERRTLELRGGPTAAEELEGLARLHEKGALTDAEFRAKKARLLDEI